MASYEDIELQLEEIKTDISELRKMISKITTTDKSTTTPEINIDTESIEKVIALQVGKALIPLDQKVYTLFEIQKKDNQQMANSLNAVLEKLYVILEKWATKVQAQETSNTVLLNTVKTSLDDLITPTIKNLLYTIRREIVAESRTVNNSVNESIARLTQETARHPVSQFPTPKTSEGMIKPLFILTLINSLGILFLIIKTQLK